jgi:NADH dehydrogenase
MTSISATETRRQPKRILIVGGGFAGVYAAFQLQRMIDRAGVNAKVAVVNRENFFVFYPMVPEIISGSIETEHVLNPIRRVAPKASLYVGEVTGIDVANRKVEILHGLFGQRQEPRTLYYDQLVLALGGVPGTANITGLDTYAFNVQRLSNAFALRNHLIDTLEQASSVSDPAIRQRLLTYLVIGGGASGVEVVAELESMLSEALRSYPRLRRADVRIGVIEYLPTLLPGLPESLIDYTTRTLQKRGVEVMTDCPGAEVQRNAVVLKDGTRIPSETIIGSLGVQTHPLIAGLPLEHDPRGRVLANEYMQVAGARGVWAIGDNALVQDPFTGQPYPQTAQHAVREAKVVARNVVATLTGDALTPITYHTKGRMVPLGHQSAVAEIYGIPVRGFPAWWIWRTYYLWQLPRWEKRLRVMFDWTLDLVFPPPLVQLKVGQPTPSGQGEDDEQ